MIVLLLGAGLGIGGLMGAVGAGGTLLAVPALVALGGQTPHEATSTSLLVVCVAAIAGLVPRLRADTVRRRAGLVFGLAAIPAAIAGARLARELAPDALLAGFAALMLAGAFALWHGASERQASFRPWRFGVRRSQLAEVLALGAATGLLMGLFGVGGGFVVVPALVLLLGLSLPEAAGTSLLVIAIGSAAALATRVGDGALDLAVAAPFLAAALAGVAAGGPLAHRVPDPILTRGLGAVVGAAAIATAASLIW